MESQELAVIGLTCNLVGVFFLANSIIFRRSRKVLEEFFGVGAGSLMAIRDYSLNKMQVIIGFLFLNTGFLLQGFATLDSIVSRLTTVLICLAIVAAAGLVYLVGAFVSRRSFQRLLREFFNKQPYSFTENMALTKEIGKMLGIRQSTDMTVEEFVFRVRAALGLSAESPPVPPSISGGDRGRKLRDLGPLPGRPTNPAN